MTGDVEQDSKDPIAHVREAVNSLSKCVHRLASEELQVHRRLLSLETAHHDSVNAVNMMLSTIRTDLKTMHHESCQQILDFLGSRLQMYHHGGSIQSCPQVQEATPISKNQSSSTDAAGIVLAKGHGTKDVKGDSKTDSGHDWQSENQESKQNDDPRAVGDVWEDFQVAASATEIHHNAYKRILERIGEDHSLWHRLFKSYGCLHFLDEEAPKTRLARAVQNPVFHMMQTLLILSNTAIMGYEADVAIKAALQNPEGEIPAWLEQCNAFFNWAFVLELLFRILAMRTWFWVSPDDWGWNVFDVVVVGASVATDLMGSVNLSFIRAFRILRAVRTVRVFRVFRFFSELRKILFSILACVSSLFWCFLFLAMTMFMFSILVLQGIVGALDGMERGSEEHQRASNLASHWYASLGDAMVTLLAAFTTGSDLFTFLDPIKPAGALYSAAYVVYILFVLVGVMNVLTGVFLAASARFTDRSMIIHAEQMEQEAFVEAMVEAFAELDLDKSGSVTWPEFRLALMDERLQAFLSAHKFDVTHARLIFDVLDEEDCGAVYLDQFVMGMLRMKGEAKALDARIVQREIGMLPKLFDQSLLNHQFKEHEYRRLQRQQSRLRIRSKSTTGTSRK